MDDHLLRMMENIVGRVEGPMKLRFLLQPIMAILFALRDGRRDAREGKPPYAWGLLTNAEDRHEMIQDGWKSVGKVFIMALVIDAVYQLIFLRWLFPVESLTVAALLALVPYVLLRGLINRLMGTKVAR